MGTNQNTWSHRTKIIFHLLGWFAGFPARDIVLWQENARGIRNASLSGHRYNDFLNVWDNVLMDLKYACQQYFTCMCLVCFIRYNKTFISWGFRKCENVFTHEYNIPLGRCPHGIWYSSVNKLPYFLHQHAIHVYYSTLWYLFYLYRNSIGRNYPSWHLFLPQQHCISLSTISYFPYSKFSRFNALVI